MLKVSSSVFGVRQNLRGLLVSQRFLRFKNVSYFQTSRGYAIAFTESHEWVKYDPDEPLMTTGITDYAQSELGDISYPDFPLIGNHFTKNDVAMNLESVKAVGDIHMPISGTITEVNETLTNSPNVVNDSPEEEGWLFKFKADNPKDIQQLMDKDAYKSFCEKL